MTLWKIPDSTTSIFMEQFYQALVDGLSVRSAVKKAQKYLIYNGASDPFYWAPFVVLD
jgi:CHAT domain-containing protein